MQDIPKDMSFVINMWSVNSIISKKLDASLGAVHGIGFTEYMILFHLNNSHNKSMRRIDLANNIGLTASGITRLVSPMEKIGLVMKERNLRDARVSLVKLTAAGEVIFGDATLSMKQTSQRLLEGVSEESLKHGLEVFKYIGKDVYV
ncbi:MAG: DNA-binding MarR family transcriptional regulator [Oceanospirillaceae bacterium]|jgi:DNA-binding MarR family transcriptional regulator